MSQSGGKRAQPWRIIQGLYRHGECYGSLNYLPEITPDHLQITDTLIESKPGTEAKKMVSGPKTIVDPRFIGYSFPSYTFVESQNNLARGHNARRGDFDQPRKALMFGTVLGDFDFIHRRVDRDRWDNAAFAKRAKNEQELSYFESIETYPIFQIVRWHGQDRKEPLDDAPDDLTAEELEILRYLMDDPAISENKIEDKIAERIADKDPTLFINNPLDDGDISTIRQDLDERDVIMGYSVDYNIRNSPYSRAIMGLTVEPGYTGHDDIVDILKGYDDELLNPFSMPYITSGWGQNWADFLIELVIEDRDDLNKIADRFRSIRPVHSTHTYLFTKSNFDHSFEISNWQPFYNG